MLMMKNFKSSQCSINKNEYSLTAAELRINKDLLELRHSRITTKLLNVKFSNIFKDNLNNKFVMIVNMESNENKIKCDFSFTFDSDYPFSAPKIDTLSGDHKVSLNIFSENNWSPVLSINSILFALELMLLDPQMESNLSFNDIYYTQHNNIEIFCDTEPSNEDLIFTNSPRIINEKSHSQNFLGENNQRYYLRKKRLLKELENINDNLLIHSICSKRFKYTQNSFDYQRMTNN